MRHIMFSEMWGKINPDGGLSLEESEKASRYAQRAEELERSRDDK